MPMSESHQIYEFSLKKTNKLYREMMKNRGIPENKNQQHIFNILNLKIPKKNKQASVIKKGANVMVLFELCKKECKKFNLIYNNKKSKNGVVKHYISGKIVKINNNRTCRIYFSIDNTTLDILTNCIKILDKIKCHQPGSNKG